MFKGKVMFQDFVTQGASCEISPENCDEDDDDLVSEAEYSKEVLNHLNLKCLGDEETYTSDEPFETIGKQMADLLPDGSIKKKILREGYDPFVVKGCIVKIHYNAYVEFNEEPFDCTYARKNPLQFKVDNGETIVGLDLAVQSMKLNEKSQYLFQPDYAYGKFGCMPRVPPNAIVLFEIEILEIIDAAAADQFEYLPPEKKEQFSEVYQYSIAQCAKAKDLFSKNYRAAIKEYNKAIYPLENVRNAEHDEQVKQQELLYKLYSNLLICYTKIDEPKKGCIAFNKINKMTKGTDLKISAKVYYNNAKCLRMLGDFNLARKRLEYANRVLPRNPDILNEMQLIDQKEKQFKEKELKMSQAFAQSLNLSKD